MANMVKGVSWLILQIEMGHIGNGAHGYNLGHMGNGKHGQMGITVNTADRDGAP